MTGSSVAGTTAPTAVAGSAASGTRPASSAITSSTVAAGSASAIVGTRPAGSATGSIIPGGTTAAGSSAAGAGVTLFTDPKGRFSFSRPAAWTVGQSTSSDSVVQFNATNPPGVLDISTESVPASATPETYRAAALAEIMKAIPDAQQVGTLSLQLDTEPAIQIDYTGTVSGNKIYFSQIFSLHKGTAYVLTLGTQPADIDKMKQQAIVLVQTWKFLQ
ncbi:MAG TPA: PsbP-related protein [Thermomicrobiales bacterium]